MPLGLPASHVPNVVIHGSNLDSNRGCQALRLTTQQILDRYLPEYARLHANLIENDEPQFLKDCADYRSLGQVWESKDRRHLSFYLWGARLVCSRLLGRFPRMRVHRRLSEADALLVVGGDNLSYDYGELMTQLCFSPIRDALDKGVKTMIWAASIGPFSRCPRWERYYADLLARTDLITVRDDASRDYLAGLGVSANVRRVIDPAFLLPPQPTELPEEIEESLRTGAVGINLAPLLSRYGSCSAREWRKLSLRLIWQIAELSSRPILCIPHVMMSPRIFPNNDDLAYMRSLRGDLPPHLRQQVRIYDASRDSSMSIKWVISRLHAFVASRLHASIAGLSSRVPTFCLGYGIKTRGLYQDLFGDDRWMLHMAEFTPDAATAKLRAFFGNTSQVRNYLNSFMPTYAERAWELGVLLRDLLRGDVDRPC